MPVEVRLSYGGHVVLDFASVTFTLDTGQPIAFEEIVKVAEEYWNDWKANSRTGKQGG